MTTMFLLCTVFGITITEQTGVKHHVKKPHTLYYSTTNNVTELHENVDEVCICVHRSKQLHSIVYFFVTVVNLGLRCLLL